jgi:hypothetical protein
MVTVDSRWATTSTVVVRAASAMVSRRAASLTASSWEVASSSSSSRGWRSRAWAMAHALALAARQPGAAMADQGVQAVGQARDLAVEPGGAQHLGQLVLAGLRSAQQQVLAQGARQDRGVLLDVADGGAQLGQRPVAHVGAVDQDPAGGGLIEPRWASGSSGR